MDPDTRFKVLGTEFHVHSAVLQVNSRFFFKFLDSVDKVSLAVNTGDFKYEWKTVLDDKDFDEWCLEDARTAKDTSSNLSRINFDYVEHTLVFENFLLALYGRSYQLASVEQLILMTKFADYYDALPLLSASLYRAVVENNIHVCYFTEHLLPIAVKLQHGPLFRDCIIHITAKSLTQDRYGCDDLALIDGVGEDIVKIV